MSRGPRDPGPVPRESGPGHDALIARLAARGFDRAAAESRADLLAAAERSFRRLVPQGSRWQWIVPGRLEIFGKHTDYAGGRSLLSAVPRGFAVVARARDDGRVRVIDARYGDVAVIDPVSDGLPRRGWATYAAVVAQRLRANFPGASLGVDIALASDLPRAAGLSSSSALVISVASAIIRRADLESRDEWRRAIQTTQDLAGYFGCMENGSSFRTLAGASGVGTEGGSEDHTAMLACRPGAVSQFAFAPVRHVDDVSMPDAWTFVIASSGVHADKAGRVRDRFNRASRAVGALVEAWTRIAGHAPASLAAALASAPDAAARLEAAARRAPIGGFSATDLVKRLTHFVHEDQRVPDAAAAFAAADAAALGSLARTSQLDAESLLGNQVPETIALVGAAWSTGAIAASSFGAGFGGSAWALAPAADATPFGDAWLAAYRRQHPEPHRVEWFTARPSPAVMAL